MSSGRIDLIGAPLDPVTMEAAVEAIERAIAGGQSIQHGCVNAAKLVRLQDDAELRRALWSCDLVTADGQSVVWASRLLGRRLPERVAGIDLMERLFERARARGYRVFLLGARPEVVARAEAVIRERHPGIVIAGSHHGYFDREEEEEVVAELEAAQPDLLFIALETPQKELFLARHRDRLRVAFAMGVGGSFDVLAGRLKRAPSWAQRAGLEWLFRLLQEPRRLARRYVVGNSRFILLVLRERLRRGPAAAPGRHGERTVILVGPDPSARGGIASAIAEIAGREAGGFRTEVVSTFAGGTRRAKVAALVRGLWRAWRRFGGPDVALVHIHVSKRWSFRRKLLFYAAARARRKEIVWQVHSGVFCDYVRDSGRLERALVRRAFARSRAVACLSETAKRDLLETLGIQNAVVVHHAVAPLTLEPPRESVILALGDVAEGKGSFVLLRAFRGVLDELPSARLVLAGLGDTARARAEAVELGIADSVELPGWVAGEEKRRLFERAAVLVQPSFSEAMPMAVLEALAAGRPVVATPVGGVPEVVIDGQNGLIVPCGDADALAAALMRLLTDPELRARLGHAARASARPFDPTAVLQELAGIYAGA